MSLPEDSLDLSTLLDKIFFRSYDNKEGTLRSFWLVDAELIRLKKHENNILHERKFIHPVFCDAIIIMQMHV